MGRCRVLEPRGKGRYLIIQEWDNERVKARVEQIKLIVEEIESNQLPEALDELNEARRKYQQQFESLANRSGLTLEELRDITAQNLRATIALDAVQTEYRILKAQIKSLYTEQLRLQEETAIPEPQDAWCADYTLSLPINTPLGSIDIPGERNVKEPTIIQPGYNGNALPVDVRDGKTQPTPNQTPEGYFWNLAMLPAWQKWRPVHRIATLTRLDVEQNLCDIVLHETVSSQQQLNVNALETYVDVPIDYMNCHARAFVAAMENGDPVLVRFIEQDFTRPEVIGFRTDPVPCNVDFLVLPVDDVQPDGYGDYEPQLFTVTEAGPAQAGAELRAVWSESDTPDALTPVQPSDPNEPRVPELAGYAVGNVNWRDQAGTSLSWWGTPSRYFLSAHSDRAPLTLDRSPLPFYPYPGMVYRDSMNILVTDPQTREPESIFEQRDIYFGGRVLATTPLPMFGAALTEHPDGQTIWIVAACGEVVNANGDPPNWFALNRETEANATLRAQKTVTVVQKTVFYATPLSDPTQWQIIGESEWDILPDVLTEIGITTTIFREANRQGWFFSASGTKAVSIKQLLGQPGLHCIEATLIWQTEDETTGDPLPAPVPAVEFVDRGLTGSGLITAGPNTTTLSAPRTARLVDGQEFQVYHAANTSMSRDENTAGAIAYDYKGDVLVEAHYSREFRSRASGSWVMDVTETPGPNNALFFEATGNGSEDYQSSIYERRTIDIRPVGSAVAGDVLCDRVENYQWSSTFTTRAYTLRRGPELPEIKYLDLRDSSALYVNRNYSTVTGEDTDAWASLYLWQDNQHRAAWRLVDRPFATDDVSPPDAPVIDVVAGSQEEPELEFAGNTLYQRTIQAQNAVGGFFQIAGPRIAGGGILVRDANSPRASFRVAFSGGPITVDPPSYVFTTPTTTAIAPGFSVAFTIKTMESVAMSTFDGAVCFSARVFQGRPAYIDGLASPAVDQDGFPVNDFSDYELFLHRVGLEADPVVAIDDVVNPPEDDDPLDPPPEPAEVNAFLTLVEVST